MSAHCKAMPSAPCADRLSAGHGCVTLYTPTKGPAAAHYAGGVAHHRPATGFQTEGEGTARLGHARRALGDILATFGTHSAE